MQYHLLVMVLAEYSSSYVLSVCLSYGVGNLYFDLAQTQQYFQTIVQLSNISKPLCSSATFPNHCAARSHSPHNVLHSPSTSILIRQTQVLASPATTSTLQPLEVPNLYTMSGMPHKQSDLNSCGFWYGPHNNGRPYNH